METLEDLLKKEIKHLSLQNSLKQGIAETVKSPSFVPSTPTQIDELHIRRICQETFVEEYTKRMV